LVASPARIEKLIEINKPVVRASYEIKILEGPTVADMLDRLLKRHPPPTGG
ncbi:MAG: GTPase, partial [Crenarchaeota archaeon]|nr:GTPase [Thermoproteota archaeon]